MFLSFQHLVQKQPIQLLEIVNPKGNIKYNEQTKITREELSLNPVRTPQREEEQSNNSDRPVSEQFVRGV